MFFHAPPGTASEESLEEAARALAKRARSDPYTPIPDGVRERLPSHPYEEG